MHSYPHSDEHDALDHDHWTFEYDTVFEDSPNWLFRLRRKNADLEHYKRLEGLQDDPYLS